MKTENQFLLAVLDDLMVNPSNYKDTFALQAIENYRFAVFHLFDMMDDDRKKELLLDFEKITQDEILEFEKLINE